MFLEDLRVRLDPELVLKVRLDKLLLERGLTTSRERAQALILAGKVMVDGQKIEKAGAGVEDSADIRLLGEDLKYVSRGGLKLEKALDHWQIDVTGMVCLDVGTSTGGFTDCLLQRGAARVIAVDTGHGQIDFRLRQDERVQLLEKTNARYLTREQLGETVDLIVMDVSFISATLVLPAVIASSLPAVFIRTGRHGARLNSRSGEAAVRGRARAGRQGRHRARPGGAKRGGRKGSPHLLITLGCTQTDLIDSPILGGEGNRECLLYGEF